MNGVMNIVKASLRNAVGRKWKFALVVFLFGAAVVVLTHAYDLAETFELIQAVGQEIESEGAEPSVEQVEAMARGAAMFALFSLLNLAFGFGTILFAFLMPGGMVADERRSGAIMLWAQHPMPLRSFYLQRYLGIQVATFVALAIFGLTGAVAALPSGTAPTTELGGVASICLTGVLACAIGFAITALGIRRAALIGLLYYLLSGAVASLLENPLLETSTAAESARAVLPFVIFPAGVIDDLVAGFGSGVAWDWGATGLAFYHFFLWTGIAWLGLRRIERRPLKL
ncbi:hypothetical protein [Candidatus Palauibacter sp.]|uniref:hypothetical protein n=1 Tax=Candidatus Palauibacter sp. TaxID=3101350 RepID=UPI003B5A4F59